ncbi:MAG: hypothetical protein K9M49_05605 [Candidatus Marinimicrobia bacterium]|nr:hypothetical protein [Candidatus Neomarinimicrobiota bacterium]MCF7904613.1 hypothetical protein [Candidatus Neomarinimicrobiota bacterium]
MNAANKRLIWLAGVSAILYLINRFVLVEMVADPTFFKSYVGDFFALPVYLPLSIWLAHKFAIIDETFTLSIWHLLLAVLIFSIIFELIVPVIDSSSTRDFGDIIAYLDGGILVFIVSAWNRNKQTNEGPSSEAS